MLWKISKMEMSNNLIQYMFIVLQSVIVMFVLFLGISIYTSRYEKLKAVKEIIGDSGIVINVEHIYWAGDNPDNMVCCEKEELEQLLQDANVFCTYNAWVSYNFKDIWYDYQAKSLAYDDEVAFAFEPQMDEGRWLKESDNATVVIEAIITNNKVGIEVGSELTIEFDSLGNPLPEPLKIKIVGVVSDNTAIIGQPMSHVEEQKDVRDCYMSYSSEYEYKPYIFFLKKDLRNAENKVFGQPYITTMIQGIQFVSFSNKITKEEEDDIMSVVKSPKFVMNNMLDMKQLDDNTKRYIWDQLNEFLPIFIAFLVLAVISVVCISAIVTRTQLRNYAIYYLLGLEWKDCAKIQIYQQIILQILSFLCVVVGLAIMCITNKTGNTLLEFGFEQISACVIYMAICVLCSGILPLIIIKRNSPKEILTNVL